MQLSGRMLAVAEMVTPGTVVADIGTDHAYVPIYLVQHGIAPSAIAMDVRPGPLSHAEANIEKYGLKGLISTRLSDGLHELKAGEADTVVMAGMGGLLMVRLLEEGLNVLGTVSECILQPQSDADSVRRFLHAHDFCIVQENMVVDDGKYYVMMKVVHGADQPYGAADDLYGKLLIDGAHPVLQAYLEKEDAVIKNILAKLEGQSAERSRRRLEELYDAQKLVREALAGMNHHKIHKEPFLENGGHDENK